MSIKGSNNPFPCHPVVFSSGNYIISQGTITRVDNVFTFSVGFVWTINGTIYQNTIPFVLTITEAAAGFFRIDNALLTTSNTIELQQGLPSNSIAIRPSYPETNLLLTSWNISSVTIGDPSSPILGTSSYKGEINLTGPTLLNGVGTIGDYYKVVEAGNYDFGAGDIYFKGGDFIYYDGSSYDVFVYNSQLNDVSFGTFSNNLTTEDDISDSDKINFTDTSDGNKQKKTTWLNIKAKVVAVIDNLFVPKIRTLTIGAETFDLSANRTFAGGSNKRTVCFTYEFNGVLNTATNNWWGAISNGVPSQLTSNASLTPVNNFSSAPVQSPAWVVPFNCRLKSITFKGFSNTVLGVVDLAFTSGTNLGSGAVLVNNTILSNQPLTLHNYLGVSGPASLYVFDTGFTNYVIPKGYEIRMFMNNRNVAKNLLSATIIVEFEEEL